MVYQLQDTNLVTSDNALAVLDSLVRDGSVLELKERERLFTATYELFLMRLEELRNTNRTLDTAEADELKLILNALIKAHARICTMKQHCS